MENKTDLFAAVVPDDKLAASFKIVRDELGHRPGKQMLQEIFSSFTDVDGNFIEQFQTTGFDSRIWELYLYAYLRDEGFSLDRRYFAPDFVVHRDQMTVCIEAVTANPTQNGEREPDWDPEADLMDEVHRRWDWVAVKLGSALFSKLKKRYWQHPHVTSRPLILAVENFSARDSLVFTDSSLARYLYGIHHDWELDGGENLVIKPRHVDTHTHGAKKIPSGFFNLPEAEHISAVMFSNSGTAAKFNRMGHQGKYHEPRVRMIRKGMCYDPEPNAAMPAEFSYEVGGKEYEENWGEGLSILHNPRALWPVPKDLFPQAAHHYLQEDGQVYSELPWFFPYSSTTTILTFVED